MPAPVIVLVFELLTEQTFIAMAVPTPAEIAEAVPDPNNTKFADEIPVPASVTQVVFIAVQSITDSSIPNDPTDEVDKAKFNVL